VYGGGNAKNYGLHQERWDSHWVVTRDCGGAGTLKGTGRTSGVGNEGWRSRSDILIFDVDGVLIDVKETFWRSRCRR